MDLGGGGVRCSALLRGFELGPSMGRRRGVGPGETGCRPHARPPPLAWAPGSPHAGPGRPALCASSRTSRQHLHRCFLRPSSRCVCSRGPLHRRGQQLLWGPTHSALPARLGRARSAFLPSSEPPGNIHLFWENMVAQSFHFCSVFFRFLSGCGLSLSRHWVFSQHRWRKCCGGRLGSWAPGSDPGRTLGQPLSPLRIGPCICRVGVIIAAAWSGD